jgi:flagellar protein FliO/FliZ
MPSKIIVLLALAAAWQPARVASGQVPGGPPAALQEQPLAAPSAGPISATPPSSGPSWPIQPASYAAPATPAPQARANSTLGPPDTALAPRLLPARKAEANPVRSSQGESAANSRPGSLGSMLTVAASLVLVLGLFLLVAWLLRRATPGTAAVLPKEVFELLGRAPLASRQQVHLVRCGRKLLLLSVSQSGIDTLSEIEDPAEVDRLAGLCLQAHPGSASMAFRQVFQQFTTASDRAPVDADRVRELRHG